jgi:UDP-2,4-diacetamido-2,4,6-trideoxy-beta-L-altropyranose hydrolase
MNLYIRVDADSKIGIGHLRRCKTLIRQLSVDGFNVRIVGRYQFGEKIESLIEGIPISWMEDREFAINESLGFEDEVRDAERTLSIIGRYPKVLSWVIVDHYGLGEKWERIIREAGHRVLVLDDFRNRKHFADILVSDSNVPFDPALNGFLGGAHQLVGAQYALVDSEFAFSEETSSSVENKKRLLISYGGSDPTDETSKALEAVRLLRHDEQCREWLGGVDLVIGHVNTRTDDVIRFAKGIEDVIVHIAPRSLAPLMRKADLFLTAGGNSMVEGLTMRKPCLVTLTSGNQSLMVAQLLEQRVILSLGDHAMVSPIDVAKAVTKILSEYEQFANNIRARPIFDHFGACRISAAIQSISKDKASNYNYSGSIKKN